MQLTAVVRALICDYFYFVFLFMHAFHLLRSIVYLCMHFIFVFLFIIYYFIFVCLFIIILFLFIYLFINIHFCVCLFRRSPGGDSAGAQQPR